MMLWYRIRMSWPTTTEPRTVFITLRLTEAEADDLDLYADSRGLNRSSAVRDAVSRVIAAEQRRSTRQKHRKGLDSPEEIAEGADRS